MRITTTREIIGKNGSKTVFVLEEDTTHMATAQAREVLELMGYYENRTIPQRLLRFVMGARS